jgi:hypothetical protein
MPRGYSLPDVIVFAAWRRSRSGGRIEYHEIGENPATPATKSTGFAGRANSSCVEKTTAPGFAKRLRRAKVWSFNTARRSPHSWSAGRGGPGEALDDR